MGEPLEYALLKAPADVESTIRWLIGQGASITQQRGGEGESFGNVLMEFAIGDAVVAITRDRSQWTLDVQIEPHRRFDFDVIHTAMTGDERQWTHAAQRTLPTQLPDGVSWTEELPAALQWLSATPNAEGQLIQLQRRRAELLFG